MLVLYISQCTVQLVLLLWTFIEFIAQKMVYQYDQRYQRSN